VSVAVITLVYQRPIGYLINEVARIFSKRMESKTVDGKQTELC
jgi:hypothetical protein